MPQGNSHEITWHYAKSIIHAFLIRKTLFPFENNALQIDCCWSTDHRCICAKVSVRFLDTNGAFGAGSSVEKVGELWRIRAEPALGRRLVRCPPSELRLS